MQKFLDFTIVIVAGILVILQSSGVAFIEWDKPHPNFISRITGMGWLGFGIMIVTIVVQISLNFRRYSADEKNELAQQEYEKKNTDKLNTLDSSLREIHSAISSSGYIYDSAKHTITPKNIQNIGNGGSGIQFNGNTIFKDNGIGIQQEFNTRPAKFNLAIEIAAELDKHKGNPALVDRSNVVVVLMKGPTSGIIYAELKYYFDQPGNKYKLLENPAVIAGNGLTGYETIVKDGKLHLILGNPTP
jgi:hypothetical protein